MPVPDKIGRYRVLRRIGSGAFATVWLGADDDLDASVAIKVLADNWTYHGDLRQRFEEEARIMRRVDSPLLVRVLDVGELPDGRPYLVMPFMTGGTLADRLVTGPLPLREALLVAAEIADGVAELHAAGVLHRDVKPSNVLFQPAPGRDRVLVTDLGLAKALANASGFTVAAGTPGYAAPEQRRPGAGLDVRSDVYGIGATLHHMLLGRPPGTGAGPRSRLALPPVVDEIVRRALHPDPRRRWPSASALSGALRTAEAALSHRRGGVLRKVLRNVVRVAAGVVALAGALALSGSAVALPPRSGWVRVGDANRVVSIAVPAAWALQLRDAGWNPAVLRLPAGHAPGLVVAPDVRTWSEPASRLPGVFVGASDALVAGGPAPALPEHPAPCVREPDRTARAAGLPAEVRRWTACPGPVSYSEVLVPVPQRGYGVYVQIRQVDGADRTDDILAGLRLAAYS
ncbi:protein kinase domain-containing protein [Dactylosporangium sp. CS-047395]|uniref:serine/threonine-protein kinase n=1 Tax=Dactylosporangium sp. CS-047395 TaxID=3239936 RepID=UPI003D939EAB